MIIHNSKILIKAAVLYNKWIPIWEFICETDEMYGAIYKHPITHKTFFKDSFKDVYYDINTKKITTGIQLTIYPENIKYKIGDIVYIISKSEYNTLKKAKISQIIYIPQSDYVYLGEQAKQEYGKYLKNQKFDFNKLYHIIVYEVKYKIEGSDDNIWEHYIYKLEEDEIH
jgi:hypothetical protein